jgi:hypothetical protein
MNDGGGEKIRELWRCAMDSRMKDGLSAGRGVGDDFFFGGAGGDPGWGA